MEILIVAGRGRGGPRARQPPTHLLLDFLRGAGSSSAYLNSSALVSRLLLYPGWNTYRDPRDRSCARRPRASPREASEAWAGTRLYVPARTCARTYARTPEPRIRPPPARFATLLSMHCSTRSGDFSMVANVSRTFASALHRGGQPLEN